MYGRHAQYFRVHCGGKDTSITTTRARYLTTYPRNVFFAFSRLCTQFVFFTNDTVIESENVIDTTNLVYVVEPGVQLLFRAPAVSLKRGEVRLTIWVQV